MIQAGMKYKYRDEQKRSNHPTKMHKDENSKKCNQMLPTVVKKGEIKAKGRQTLTKARRRKLRLKTLML